MAPLTLKKVQAQKKRIEKNVSKLGPNNEVLRAMNARYRELQQLEIQLS